MNKILLKISAVVWFLAFSSYSGDLQVTNNRDSEKHTYKKEHFWNSSDPIKEFAVRRNTSSPSMRESTVKRIFSADFLFEDKFNSKGSEKGKSNKLGDVEFEKKVIDYDDITHEVEARKFLKKPTHVAIIIDGNRRWAQENELHRSDGHKKIFTENAPQIIEDAFDLGINTLTFWCFSTENWKRDKDEVDNLMNYFEILVEKLVKLAIKLEFRVIHLGRKDRITPSLAQIIAICEEETKLYNKLTLNLAIDYGGQDEIVRAVKKLHEQSFDFKELERHHIMANLDTASQSLPSPDLVIRTSKTDNRMSGFMAWQNQYSELYLSNCYAPDLRKKHLIEGVRDLERRKRSYSL